MSNIIYKTDITLPLTTYINSSNNEIFAIDANSNILNVPQILAYNVQRIKRDMDLLTHFKKIYLAGSDLLNADL